MRLSGWVPRRLKLKLHWLSKFRKNNSFFGQDPWVTPYNDTFLLIQSAQNDTQITIQQFRDPLLKHKLKEVTIWAPEVSSGHSKMIWAPELHMFQAFSDKWYVYFSASNGSNENHRMYVLESRTPDPLGPYREIGKIADKTDTWAIDLTVLEYKEKLYAIWSGWETRTGDFPQNLYIAHMSNPWTIAGDRVCISQPEYEWEKSIEAINEGPQVLRKGKNLFITYSADASWTPAYKLGMLSFSGGNILSPTSWSKNPKPIFEMGTTSIYGPGHASFITHADNDYIVYHHKVSKTSGWERQIKVQRFNWSPSEMPLLGFPQ